VREPKERYGGSWQRGFLMSEGCFSTTHPDSPDPAAPTPRDYNLMTHNTSPCHLSKSDSVE